MQLLQTGIAGTMESGDIYVEIESSSDKGIRIDLDSTVGGHFGKQIRKVITESLQDCGVDGVSVRAIDKGALDCTIRARVTAAAYRGAERDAAPWREQQ